MALEGFFLSSFFFPQLWLIIYSQQNAPNRKTDNLSILLATSSQVLSTVAGIQCIDSDLMKTTYFHKWTTVISMESLVLHKPKRFANSGRAPTSPGNLVKTETLWLYWKPET